VVTACNGSRISLHAWIALLLTDNASPGSSDGMMLEFLVEEGGMENLVIAAISLISLTESLDRKHVTALFINDVDIFIIVHVEEFSLVISISRKCIISEERFVLELPTSRAMLATARLSCSSCNVWILTSLSVL